MPCTSFTATSGAIVQLTPGLLPVGFCHTDWQSTLDAFVAAIEAQVPGTYTTFLVSDTEPLPQDRTKPWIAVDPSNCRPLGLRLWLNGAWVEVGARVFYGVDSGSTDNAYSVTATTPNVNWAEAGHVFLVKTTRTNTGPVTLTIGSTYVNTPVKKFGAAALVASEVLSGTVMALVYDGTNFQLLNPAPVTVELQFRFYNQSFDVDVNGDNVPDRWQVVLSGSATGSLVNSDLNSGGKSFKAVVPGGTNQGVAILQTIDLLACSAGEVFPVSWWQKNSAIATPVSVTAKFYDSAGVDLGTPYEVYNNNANNPPAWYQLCGFVVVPVGARFFRLVFQAGATTSTAGDVYFDDVRAEEPRRFRSFAATTAGTYKWLCPSGVYQARSFCLGSGGAGGSYTAQASSGGGGGCAVLTYVPVVPGTIYDAVVPAGGAVVGNNTGGSGAACTFAINSAGGGTGGATGASPGSGGVSGTSAPGRVVVNGSPGVAGNGTPGLEGDGGASARALGGAGFRITAPVPAGTYTGAAGSLGSGGGGGHNGNGGAGGAGAFELVY